MKDYILFHFAILLEQNMFNSFNILIQFLSLAIKMHLNTCLSAE